MNNKRTEIGTIVSLSLPQISSQLFSSGFDFVFIDLEHGHVDESSIASIVLCKPINCKVLIRIAEISETSIKHALDIGCDGIVAPRIESMDEIKMLIDYSFYSPIGKRSVGFGLANKYGHNFKDYTDNFRPIILPQVESVKGLELAESIAATERVAGIFIGPYDLSMSLGVPGQFDSPTFQNSFESVRTLCNAHKKLFCTFTSNTTLALEEIRKGTDMIAVGVDANLFLTSYSQIINNLKNA